MRISAALAMVVGLAGTLFAGCASEDNLRLAREPAMPPVYVMRAAPDREFFQNISVQEVEGAPEFRWFDGDAILTTRPTRLQTLQLINNDLDRVGMLAPSRVQSEYMLYIKFEDLHGPDVIWFTDKRASAAITFRLVNWRTGALVKSERLVAAYQANLGGVAPEVVRNFFFGPIGLAKDNPIQPIGGVAGGMLFNYILLDPHEMERERHGTPTSMTTQIGPFNGTDRRFAAWHGLLNLAFDEFIQELSKDGSIQYKTAVGCSDLNPPRSPAELVETKFVYAIDCHNSYYMESLVHRVYPAKFQ